MGWLWGVTAGPLDVRGGPPGVGILLLQIRVSCYGGH